jgi:menaquinone-dependent protoporphyrinogen oxidase
MKSMRVLLIYSTVDGHTREIAERIAHTLGGGDCEVVTVSLDADEVPGPKGFDRVVIGASIRYGRHRDNVAAYIDRHAEALAALPGAFFSVNLVARKPNRREASNNPYVKRFLRAIRWQPDEVAVFAGKLDYPRYRFWDRLMIRLIMWMTKGPTDPSAVVDYTDWEQVEAFARRVAELRRAG